MAVPVFDTTALHAAAAVEFALIAPFPDLLCRDGKACRAKKGISFL
jgi:hypothetical protein